MSRIVLRWPKAVKTEQLLVFAGVGRRTAAGEYFFDEKSAITVSKMPFLNLTCQLAIAIDLNQLEQAAI